jgi:hypothetical protein
LVDRFVSSDPKMCNIQLPNLGCLALELTARDRPELENDRHRSRRPLRVYSRIIDWQ